MNTQQADRKVVQQHPLMKSTIRERFLSSLKKRSFTSKDVYAFTAKLHPERYVHQTEGFAAVIGPLLFEQRIRRVERGKYEVLSKKEVS
jgi:hypothetical protein